MSEKVYLHVFAPVRKARSDIKSNESKESIVSLAILGKKLGMTQIFEEDGTKIPVTVIEAGPCPVVQIKTEPAADGSHAIQLGFELKKKNVKKPQSELFKKVGIEPHRHLRECRLPPEEAAKYKPGSVITIDIFAKDEIVDIIGKSKGCGFQGVMKRHGMHGGKSSHGVHEAYRHGGSIGASASPARVFKGVRMPGQMGNVRVTVKNLQIVDIRKDKNLLLLKGPVPGPTGGFVMIRKK